MNQSMQMMYRASPRAGSENEQESAENTPSLPCAKAPTVQDLTASTSEAAKQDVQKEDELRRVEEVGIFSEKKIMVGSQLLYSIFLLVILVPGSDTDILVISYAGRVWPVGTCFPHFVTPSLQLRHEQCLSL